MSEPTFTVDEIVEGDLFGPFQPAYGDPQVDANGVRWHQVDAARGAEHRWYTEHQITLAGDNGQYWARTYLVDNSESQDGQFNEDERWPDEWYLVSPRAITITQYEKV